MDSTPLIFETAMRRIDDRRQAGIASRCIRRTICPPPRSSFTKNDWGRWSALAQPSPPRRTF